MAVLASKDLTTAKKSYRQRGSTWCKKLSLLAMIDPSAVQSPAQTFIHNAILFIETFNTAWYNTSSLANWDAIFVDNC